jgi:hypothetical protein
MDRPAHVDPELSLRLCHLGVSALESWDWMLNARQVAEAEKMGLPVSTVALGMNMRSSKGSTRMSRVAVCKVLRSDSGSLLLSPSG